MHRLWYFQTRPSQLLPDLFVGLTTGAVGVLFDLSFAALIFSGALSNHLSVGVGLVLFSAAATRVMTALISSYPGFVADLGTVPTAILAWSVGSIAQQLPTDASATEVLMTVLVTIGLISLFTGAFLLLLGMLRVGEIVRSVPYPVVGGFVASTGWLLVRGAFKVMLDQPLNWSHLAVLFQTHTLLHWIPGLVLGIYLLLISHRRSHPLVIPSSLFAAVFLFYILLSLTGTSIAQAGTQGWTLGASLSQPQSWQPIGLLALGSVHWQMIADQFTCMVTIAIVTAISLLLNVSGLEPVVNREIDVNRELKVAGIANIAIGLGGGILSYHSLSKSVLAHKMGSTSRFATLVTAVVFASFPLFGFSLLSYFPRSILGGLLLFLGLSLLSEWTYEAWFNLPKTDYWIVQLILVVSGAVGFLQGLIVGWIVAAVLFIVTYSRIHTTPPGFSGVDCPSSKARSPQECQYLQQQGDQIYVIELQGLLFFGTANSLVNQIQQRIANSTLRSARFIVLNFRLVSEIDSSAVQSFVQIRQLAQRHGLTLVITNLRTSVETKIRQAGYLNSNSTYIYKFTDFDQGLIWCEDQILTDASLK